MFMSEPWFSPRDYGRFRKAVESIDEILECYHVTGEKSRIPRRALLRLSLESGVRELSAASLTLLFRRTAAK